jgi:hypothetical protein
MAWIAETCGRCGKPLKTDKSRELGYGPVCIRKVEEQRAKDQTVIDEYIEEGNNADSKN